MGKKIKSVSENTRYEVLAILDVAMREVDDKKHHVNCPLASVEIINAMALAHSEFGRKTVRKVIGVEIAANTAKLHDLDVLVHRWSGFRHPSAASLSETDRRLTRLCMYYGVSRMVGKHVKDDEALAALVEQLNVGA